MSIEVDLQNPSHANIPEAQSFSTWISLALEGRTDVKVTVRVVDVDEIQKLNLQFRGKDKPTNVLSFPNPAPLEFSDGLLGDMVICHSVLAQEATQQKKDLTAHWAHMVIHSTLHLLGYDHQAEDEAQQMEKLEIQFLQQLGYSNPYEEYHG